MLFEKKESGQGLIEYALILVLIAIVVVVALRLFGPSINGAYNTIGSWLNTVG